VSVAELRGVDGYADEPGGPGFDRQPPQDLVAEQCVLGAMLLSKDAIADVVEVLRPDDFYKPAHQTVYDTVLDLYGRGDPADAITVSNALVTRGEIARIGGAPYLHTLLASVPTAANAGYYAKIVRERAILRRLVEAGTRIVQMGYSAEGEADDVVDRAQAEVYSVTERRSSEDYLPLSAIMEGTLDEIDAIANHGGAMIGVPTGFTDLDQLTNGLHGGQMVVVAARPAVGKALALDTPLPTPDGWTTMGEIHVGDLLIGADGRPTRVVAATEVMVGRPCYEVSFSDGSRIVADAEHQWLTETRTSRRWEPEVRTTREIAETVWAEPSGLRLNHSVANADALRLPDRALPLAPYVFGAWLGSRNSDVGRLMATDPEVAMYVEAEGCTLDGLSRGPLPDGIADTRIPETYLRASEAQRRALLAGLLDTDGTVSRSGAVQFAVTSRRLAEDFRELVHSLGYRAGWSSKRVKGRTEDSSTAYLVSFMADDEVFRLQRKQLVHKERDRRTFTRRDSRFITEVRAIQSVPVRCVEVDNADHLYLAGRSMIPTHNSTLGLDICRSASIKHGLTSVIFSLEMGRNEITMRLLAAEAKVGLHKMRSGQLGEADWNHLARTMSTVADAPLFIDDSPNMSMMEIRAKCRRLKQRHELRLVIIDYLQLMTSGKRVESRQQEVSEFSRALKLLAKELQVPVIALSQLNRGPEQRADKMPALSDLRESGSIEQDADMVILLHRESAYERDSPRAGEADLIVAKHRNGPTRTITVAFHGHFSRFADMVQV
jgi:replicative DNA helicase